MNWTLLIAALIQVETHGNDIAIGDNGKSHGCLQIQQGCLDDVNKYYKTSYVRNDCYDRKKSIAICRMYLVIYGKAYQKRSHEVPTMEVYARIWNGGYAGYLEGTEKTDGYWRKVKEELEDTT